MACDEKSCDTVQVSYVQIEDECMGVAVQEKYKSKENSTGREKREALRWFYFTGVDLSGTGEREKQHVQIRF